MKKPILKAHAIYKSYSTPQIDILKGIDLEVERGETIAIMGKSGEGKTTLLHILGFLEKPCRGEVTLCEKTSSTGSSHLLRRQHIGFIFQAFHLFENHTVLSNILMPASIARKDIRPQSPAYRTAIDLIDEIGLKERQDALAKTLSGGERQRVAIARALMNDPDIILADEPSGNLDHHQSEQIHHHLIKAARERGKAVIIATHDRSLAELCSKILFLQEGRLHVSY